MTWGELLQQLREEGGDRVDCRIENQDLLRSWWRGIDLEITNINLPIFPRDKGIFLLSFSLPLTIFVTLPLFWRVSAH